MLWATAVLSALPVIGFFSFRNKSRNSDETIVMLSEDGKLVEIDKKLLSAQDKKISNEELQQWIKNKPMTDGK